MNASRGPKLNQEHEADGVTPMAPTGNGDGGNPPMAKKRTAMVLCTLPDGTPADPSLWESSGGTLRVDRGHRVRVDRAGRSPEDRKRMDDYIYQVRFGTGQVRLNAGTGRHFRDLRSVFSLSFASEVPRLLSSAAISASGPTRQSCAL